MADCRLDRTSWGSLEPRFPSLRRDGVDARAKDGKRKDESLFPC